MTHPPGRGSVEMLAGSVDDIANQLCQAVDGRFDFLVTSPSSDDTVQKLVMLTNFLLDSARRAIELVELQKAEIERDAARRRLAEEALARKAEELARSNADLAQFAYVTSHDLQEPLRMVASYMQLLEQRFGSELGPEAVEFIGFAVDGARRMKALIEALLNYSRVSTQGSPFTAVDCKLAAERALANLRPALDETAATVTLGELPTVSGDGAQLTQLFQNLIANGLKFRSEAVPHIRISATRTDREWTFAVEDNGIGIASEYHERIFVIFQRLHARPKYDGTGIGLAICKKIVERHGGRIWVASKRGDGATFTFTLPAVSSAARS
jgi:light-regulated signal transduction histidine kinase (bacteriophytochrome)